MLSMLNVVSLMYSDGLDIKVSIVWGAPASGKTTYVREHMQDGDLIVDLDLIKQSLSMQGKTQTGDSFLNLALSIREHIYELIEYREVIKTNHVWVIAGLPKQMDREYLYNRLQANEMIYIKATKKECIQRAYDDAERTDKEIQHMIISKWFRQYTA